MDETGQDLTLYDKNVNHLVECIAELAAQLTEVKSRKISVPFPELVDAEPEMLDETNVDEWDNMNTVEQQELLLAIIRRRRTLRSALADIPEEEK